MIIVAFLQNLWVRDPEKAKKMLDHYEDKRHKIIKGLLFMGGLTGKRIMKAFGEELTEQIIFEEASREIAGDSRTICKPDPQHIRNILEKYTPDLVITFGQVAHKAVSEVYKGKIIVCPHPAARQVDIMEKLSEEAKKVRKMIDVL